MVIRRPGDLTRGRTSSAAPSAAICPNQLYSALLYEQLREELAHRRHLESDRETIFNESVDYITVIDGHGRFAQINPAFARRLGSTPQALLGRSIFDFIHPDDRAFALCTLREMRARGVVRGFCNRFVSLDGTVGYVENNLKYMENGSTIAIARDVTDQRRMEARNSALEESVNLERMKSELLAGISHEFKTPLNIVLSSLDLMRTKSSMEDPERFQRDYARFFSAMPTRTATSSCGSPPTCWTPAGWKTGISVFGWGGTGWGAAAGYRGLGGGLRQRLRGDAVPGARA